jgi:intracellular sulfur oxidation DsrE/DsrF family protein
MRYSSLPMFLLFVSVAWTGMAAIAQAQRGRGEPSGIARRSGIPELVVLSGEVREIETGPCEMTTGRALQGTHFLLETPEGKTVNVHLGPARAVKFVADRLSKGAAASIRGFQTEKMPENRYVAQIVTVNGQSFRLRDQGLRPVWASGRRAVRRGPVRSCRGRTSPGSVAQSAGTFANPLQPAVRGDVRVVYQVKNDAWKDGRAAGLHYLEKLARQYDSLEIGRSQRRIHGVFHGDAGYFLLKDRAYREETDESEPNPNRQLVAQLVENGIELELCKSTMQSHGWRREDVLPGVRIVVAAYPRIIDLQQRGYAYIRF